MKRNIIILLVLSVVLLSGFLIRTVYKKSMQSHIVSSKERPISILPTIPVTQAISPKDQNIIRGVALNPIQNVALDTNPITIQEYVKNISKLRANTISLYNCGLFDWESQHNVSSAKTFCEKVYAYAAEENLQVIPGYFSNTTQNWESPETIARASTQLQELVTSTKHFPFIHYYLIGNEIFEKLPNIQAKNNYARWVAQMSLWVTANAPGKEIIYADNVNLEASPYLQQNGANLTTYAINDYEWGSASDLAKKIKEIQTKIPGERVLLHEWGVDSFDVSNMQEDQMKQAARIVYLAKEIDKVAAQFPDIFMGSVLFSFTDDLSKLGNPLTRDQDKGASWECKTCFDNKANEEYWGIYKKAAYEFLRSYWNSLSKSN